MERLSWDKLLCEKRIRQSSTDNEYVRNAFEADYDRIVGSSSVRRLQDKAQVFPLQPNDVVRTRLTHSMEVSAIAASLGKRIGRKLENAKIDGFSYEMTEKLVALLQTAGLIHDLGNPPFGHYGEKIIQKWYKEKVLEGNKSGFKKEESNYKQEDYEFLHFDGNVQNLRIMTKLQTLNDKFGANFTYGTLATIMKYPYKASKDIKKFGYFKTEESIVKEIRQETGLDEGVRHPATYILEAADDITYICDDIEDGVKKGLIPWEKECKKLIDKYCKREDYKVFFSNLSQKMNTVNTDLSEKEQVFTSVRFFRNMMQVFLIDKAEDAFKNNYEAIMSGDYKKKDLLARHEELIKDLKSITSKYCFSCEEVVSLELVGERVLTELLNAFYVLVESDDNKLKDSSCYEGKIYSLISDNYRYIYDIERNNLNSDEEIRYQKIHLIVDFISGMTDSYAVRLYKRLSGISLLV